MAFYNYKKKKLEPSYKLAVFKNLDTQQGEFNAFMSFCKTEDTLAVLISQASIGKIILFTKNFSKNDGAFHKYSAFERKIFPKKQKKPQKSILKNCSLF